jgi:hypothetical protein
MSWCVYRIADRTGVELDALLDPQARVVSEHGTYREAGEALAAYRQRLAEEAEWMRSQLGLFGGQE